MEERQRNTYRVFVGMPKGKRTLLRPRQTWENTTKIDLKETEYENVHGLHLA
jgi:hypothetical protein